MIILGPYQNHFIRANERPEPTHIIKNANSDLELEKPVPVQFTQFLFIKKYSADILSQKKCLQQCIYENSLKFPEFRIRNNYVFLDF